MLDTTKKKIGFVLNIVVLLLEVAAFVTSGKDWGVNALKYYTEDSNYLSLFACLAMLIFTLRCMGKKEGEVPEAVYIVKYMSVCCLMVTFIVVMTVLWPMSGPDGYKRLLFWKCNLYKHLLCPVFAFISFVFFEADHKFKRKYVLYALMPTVAYAIVSITLNVLKLLHGPYPFLYVYEQPVYMSVVWTVVIISGALLIAGIIYKIINWRNRVKD